MALYLEDLHEGQTFVSGSRDLTAAAIKAFAAEYDPQPFHLSEAAAAASFFEGLAASGWQTAAVTMRLLTESVPLAGGIIGGGGEIRWPMATRPGDSLTVTTTVEAVSPSRSRPERGSVTLRSETRNQRGETVQILVSRILAFRRPTT